MTTEILPFPDLDRSLQVRKWMLGLLDKLEGTPKRYSILAQIEREHFDGTNAETSGRPILRVTLVPAETVPKVYALIEKARAKMAEKEGTQPIETKAL